MPYNYYNKCIFDITHLVGQTSVERIGAPLPRHNRLEHLLVGLDENAVPVALQLEEEAVGIELAVEAARLHVEAAPLGSQQAVDVLGLAFTIYKREVRDAQNGK